MSDAVQRCWLCSRPLGRRTEYHHPMPKSRGGRDTVPIHPICHRTLHKTFSNAELALFGEKRGGDPGRSSHGRFLAWIKNRDPDFHAPTR
jgi:hypothetical protein